ncbi:dicarboxylate/amino acid:cation symporter [Taibaiella koreensis]|uniref:dicarboxylate/amino acid:cation symporter n=1 Tax=Taibaiella koreensis TaxID=1268548 RepID=UPI000E59DA8B|nr:cation:dicarboxylase symporter family transporter [Taibaiella koreensis]
MKKIFTLISILTLSIAAVFSLLYLNKWIDVNLALVKGSWWLFAVAVSGYAIYRKSLTTWILVAMMIGVLVGFTFREFALDLQVLSKIFLKLIKTVIGPILFATLVVGIAGHANLKQLGRMGWKSLLYFEIVTTLALVIGLLAINISQAGKHIDIPHSIIHELPRSSERQMQEKVIAILDSADVSVPPGLINRLPDAPGKSWKDHILDIFPENIAKAVAEGQVLPIVIFSILFGIALAMIPEERKKPMLAFAESLAETMFKFTNIIMYFAPFGVGAAIAHATAELGTDILFALAKLLLTLYCALAIFVVLVFGSVLLICRIPVRTFYRAVKEPVSIAFATTSSESALPKAMENMEKIGVPRKIVSFVIPTGYTFNLDGTTLYLSLASIFVAQAAGIELSIGSQLLIGLTLMLTSKGVAGVPRASLVILIGAAATFHLPLWPIMAIFGIDELMDMARTSVNVMGNCLASCVVARWEKELDEEKLHAEFIVD